MIKGGAGGLKILDARGVTHITVYSLDRSKFPRVFIQKCIICALYLGTKFITELGHGIAA
jgi:hypothetical protein